MINSLRPINGLSAVAFPEFFQMLFKNGVLIRELTKRNFRDRYMGQVLGRVWMFVHPLLIVSIYVFLFGSVFKARLHGTDDALPHFSAYILAGLIPWMCLVETFSRASTVVIAQASLVKQVVFPIEVLPIVNVLAALVTQAVMLVLFLIYSAFIGDLSFGTIALLVPALVLQFFMLSGFSYGLAALGVYLRDLKDLVQVFTSIGIYLAPIVYMPNWVPDFAKPFLLLNPFSYMAWCFQDALYSGRVEHGNAWLVFGAFSLIAFFLGFRLFSRVRPFFGSVL